MAVVVTANRAQAIYDCLRHFVPYTRMKLPPGDEVAFHITRHNTHLAHYTCERYKPGTHEIIVSDYWAWTIEQLVKVIGHEMIHMDQRIRKTDSLKVDHNREFQRIERKIARAMGWERFHSPFKEVEARK